MNANEIPKSLDGLSTEEIFAFAARMVPAEVIKKNLATRQAWYRETFPTTFSKVYYHVTLKDRLDRILGTDDQPGEGLIPSNLAIKHCDDNFETEGKIHLCETLKGDSCSAERWIREFSKKDGLPEEAYSVLIVDLTHSGCRGYRDAYSSQCKTNWIIESGIERSRLKAV